MKKTGRKIFVSAVLLALLFVSTTTLFARSEPVNYYYQQGALLDISDNIGDDKGPGYYQYPLDKRMRRGVFDIKHFTVYEEGQVVVFEIQMRNYIMREWPDTSKSEDQGFVANMWDIYIDINGLENSGYQEALPGRDLFFADNMGWEKMIMVSPLSESQLFDILRDKGEELNFQDRVNDIVYPDYIRIQRDKAIIKIAKVKLPGISEKSGFQCLSMGFSNIVSLNRLLNRDVRAFATTDDFGGGHDTYGDPPVMDIIVPEGEDQYKLLRNFKSEPYRENIEYAAIPFVYAGGQRYSSANSKPSVKTSAETQEVAPVKAPVVAQPAAGSGNSGFVPLKPVTQTNPGTDGFKPVPKTPGGFMPVKKKD
ncbi:MAG: hypothetical protein EOM80_13350 [Erysipelotrichia bacterium]|nr:hypothetical protein [Erysipelotrichia bacterium]